MLIILSILAFGLPIPALLLIIAGTDYLKWLFFGVNYKYNDKQHFRNDIRDRTIGVILLIINVIAILLFLLYPLL